MHACPVGVSGGFHATTLTRHGRGTDPRRRSPPPRDRDPDELVAYVWYVEHIEAAIERQGKTRLAILEEARDRPCVCGGQWGTLADDVPRRSGRRRSDVQGALPV